MQKLSLGKKSMILQIRPLFICSGDQETNLVFFPLWGNSVTSYGTTVPTFGKVGWKVL